MSDKNIYKNLNSYWTLYLHLHDNKDWSFESYIKIMKFNSVENAILLNDEINYDLIKKSMIFLMKDDIKPLWEDDDNKNGGCFSFKILNKDIESVWKQMYFSLIGQTLTKDKMYYKNINGITLSPKKKFCILKIWMKDCTLKDNNIFININNLCFDDCIFKKHINED